MSIKVLHVINGLGPAGAETTLYRLATRSSANEQEVICLGTPDSYSPLLEEHGITVHHLNVTSVASAIPAMLRLRYLIKKSGADVVQCWMYRSNVLGGTISKTLGIPTLWNIRSSSIEPASLPSRLLVYAGGLLARWVPDFVIHLSRSTSSAHERFGYGRAPSAVVNNGFDPQEFYPDAAARRMIREALGIGPDEFVIGSISRWNSFKDIPTLLRAVARATDRGISLRCVLVGHELDPSNDQLTKLIRETGTDRFVLPLGRRADIPKVARAMDLHVLPSISEAFGNAVAETMLSGVPNVATYSGGSPEIVGGTGWIVPPRDPQKLANRIAEAYHEWQDEPVEWENRRSAARKQVTDHFSFEKMAAAYDQIWRSVADRPRIAGSYGREPAS